MEKKTLYRYFGNCATKEERIQVLEWTKASPENLKEFCRERNIYNAILLSTDNIQRTKYDFRRHYRAQLLRIAAVVILLLSVAFGSFYLTMGDRIVPLYSLTVPAGNSNTLLLPDGTKVWLNAGSTIKYPSSFLGMQRNIEIEGEAYLEVAHNRWKPFIVNTPNGKVKVLGTKFYVTSTLKEKDFMVSLIEGSVKISSGEKSAMLKPGYRAQFKDGEFKQSVIRTFETELWKDGIYYFKDKSFDDMAGRVGRNPVMWWNNPVNDDHDDRIYMRELTTHWTIEKTGAINTLNGLILNPMNQAQASKIALFGAADYSWNPNAFDVHKNWEEVFHRIADPGDTQTAEAIKCFARFSNTLVEDEEMITLYDNFMEKFGGESFPPESDKLRNELENLKQACTYIETLKDSPHRDYRLMYEDIRCWNAKLKNISTIALDALDMLEYGNSMSRSEGWEKYLRLKSLYAGMSADSAYLVSALEGYGTSTREVFYEVKPGESHLRPFTNFLVEKVGNGMPGVWPAKDSLQIITNIENLQGVELTAQNETIRLAGLNGLDLDKDEYVGIYFGNIEKINVKEITTDKTLRVEISENGKQWTPIQLPIREQKTAYIRIKNISEEKIAVDFNQLSVSRILTSVEITAEVSTNMSQYEYHSITNVIDGNPSTFFWSSEAQAADDYILLTYPSAQPIYEISITFTETDQLSGTAAIEVSADNDQWQTVTEFTNGHLDSTRSFTCNANGLMARYVRFIIRNTVGSYWLQVAEFKADMSEKYTQTTDQSGVQIATLADKDLSTNYQAGEAGYIEHHFIENITIESIEIFHNTVFDSGSKLPSIYVNNGSEWIEKGSLEPLCTVIDTHEIDTVTAVKIEWNKENIPNLYEILPVGTPYVEKPGKPTAINNMKKDGLTIYTNNNRLIVQSDDMIQNIILFDLNGKTINHFNVNKCIFETTFGSNIPQILIVQVMHTNENLSTCKIIR